jgi:hypothetical protein
LITRARKRRIWIYVRGVRVKKPKVLIRKLRKEVRKAGDEGEKGHIEDEVNRSKKRQSAK